MIRANLTESDFGKLSSFLYGDEIMAMRGGAPIGMPYCGGYACGYALIQRYLEKTGGSLFRRDPREHVGYSEENRGFLGLTEGPGADRGRGARGYTRFSSRRAMSLNMLITPARLPIAAPLAHSVS